jgi:hypothetical protein
LTAETAKRYKATRLAAYSSNAGVAVARRRLVVVDIDLAPRDREVPMGKVRSVVSGTLGHHMAEVHLAVDNYCTVVLGILGYHTVG